MIKRKATGKNAKPRRKPRRNSCVVIAPRTPRRQERQEKKRYTRRIRADLLPVAQVCSDPSPRDVEERATNFFGSSFAVCDLRGRLLMVKGHRSKKRRDTER